MSNRHCLSILYGLYRHMDSENTKNVEKTKMKNEEKFREKHSIIPGKKHCKMKKFRIKKT